MRELGRRVMTGGVYVRVRGRMVKIGWLRSVVWVQEGKNRVKGGEVMIQAGEQRSVVSG